MNLGFDLAKEAAKPKRATEDAPTQVPMRPAKLRRNPDKGQIKARRQQARKTAAEDRKGHSITCPKCGATDLDTRVWPDGSRLDANCPNCGWRGTKTKKTASDIQVDVMGDIEIMVAPSFVGGEANRPSNDDTPAWHWEVLDRNKLSIGVMGQTVDDGYVDTEAEAWAKARATADAYAQSSGRLFASRQTKESHNVNFNQREAELLSAMGRASLADQRVLAAELESVRAAHRAALQDDRDVDIASGVVRDHLTPVLTHGLNTTATDWIGEVGDEDIDVEAAIKTARAEAGAWFERTSADVRADREEFAEQAQGKARVVASQHGSAAPEARRAFLDTVAFLHRRTADSAVAVDPLPDSTPGPQDPDLDEWTERMTTGDTGDDAEVGNKGYDGEEGRSASLHTAEVGGPDPSAPFRDEPHRALTHRNWPQQVHGTAKTADDSPGKVDREQSGNAESTVTDYDTEGNDDEPFDTKQTGVLPSTGPVEVPSTRAPNVTGSRDLSTIAADVIEDWDDAAASPAATYLAAMASMRSVNDTYAYGGASGQAVVAYFLRRSGSWQGERADALRAELVGMLDPVYARVASMVTAADKDDTAQSGDAGSSLDEVEVGNPNDRPPWPWEMPNIGNEGPATGGDAANVSSVPTPGGQSGYPQPKRGELQADAGGGLDNLGDSKAPPFGKAKGDGDDDEDDKKESALVAEGEYHYVHKRGDKWVITQKGTGKVLSTHDSQDQAEASFRAMMRSKHGGSLDFIDQDKLAAFRSTVAANVGRADPFVREGQGGGEQRHTALTLGDLEERPYEATCPNPSCPNHGTAFVHDDFSSTNENDDDEAVCPDCETPLVWENRKDAAYNPFTDQNNPYVNPKKPDANELRWREVFPEGVPLHGDLTPEQERELKRRGSAQKLANIFEDPNDVWVYVDANGTEHGWFSGADKAEMDSTRTPGADYTWRKVTPDEVGGFKNWYGDQWHAQSSLQTEAIRHYTHEELSKYPTIEQGHTDDLKLNTGTHEYWLSRMTKEDGEPFEHTIHVERHDDKTGGWTHHESYDGDNPSRKANLQAEAGRGDTFGGSPVPAEMRGPMKPCPRCGGGGYEYSGATSLACKRCDGVGSVPARSSSDPDDPQWGQRSPYQRRKGSVDQTKLDAFRATVAQSLAAVSDYKVGDRVELHPATDAWMFGDRYGEVAKIGREKVHVKMDRSGRTLRMHPDNIRGKVD